MRPIGSPEELERRRKRAVKLIRERIQPRRAISQILGVTLETLSRWKTRANNGPHGLDAIKNPGPKFRMTEKQLKRLEKYLLQGAIAHGWPNELWTAKRVTELIERKFNIHYNQEHVRKILNIRLKWTSQKPVKQAKQRNDEEAKLWRDHSLPEIKKKAEKMHAHIVFEDESGFSLSPSVKRTLAPCGSTPILKTTGFREKISAISAITISPAREKMGLSFKLMPPKENVQGVDIVKFLQQLKRQMGRPIILVWDKGSIHRAKVVKTYLKKHPEIETCEFPSYSPDLNPDEGVWKHSKGGDLANSTPKNAEELHKRLENELYKIKKRPGLLKSLVRHALHKSWKTIAVPRTLKNHFRKFHRYSKGLTPH
ncbi:MAG: IS630 family transposase [Candidatus Ozemobacteraceae bacterium]